MKNTLIVKYTPREDRSRTRELVDYFKEFNKDKSNFEELDLTKDVPEFFLHDNLSAYYKRNYGGIELSVEEKKLLEKFDRFTSQFIESDEVVIAYPMFNFGLPGIVKTYLDMIALKGETWDMTEDGFVGLTNGKRIVLITTSAGKYEGVEGFDAWEHSIKYMKVLSGFFGADLKVIDGGGIMSDEEKIIRESKAQIEKL